MSRSQSNRRLSAKKEALMSARVSELRAVTNRIRWLGVDQVGRFVGPTGSRDFLL